jgi:uncharacterized protein (TIGR03083 family)
MIEPSHGLAELERAASDVVDLIGEARLDVPVPSCPGWTVADLVDHLGQTHLWAEHCIRVGDPNAPETVAPVADREALAVWYAGCADLLITTLRATDPGIACWTFGESPGTAAFWFRRQAHEVAVHRWDLGAALGRDLGYPNPLAADGVDEVVTLFFPRQVRLGRTAPLARSLAVRVAGLGPLVVAGDGSGAYGDRTDAEVGGPADALVLLLWGRIGLDDPRIELTGDTSAAAAVLSAGIVP